MLQIPGEPIAKGRPRFTRQGIAFTPAKTQKWESYAKLIALEHMQGRKPLECPLLVSIHAYFQVPRSWPKWRIEQGELENVRHTGRPDADNLAKTLDAFNGIL